LTTLYNELISEKRPSGGYKMRFNSLQRSYVGNQFDAARIAARQLAHKTG